MAPHDLLNLGRVDVEPAGDDHVLLAIDDIDVAVFVLQADIAGAVPAVGGRDLVGGLLVLVIAGHHQGAAYDDFAPLARRQDVLVIVHDLDGRQQTGLPAARQAVGLVGRQRLGVGLGRQIGADHRRFGLAVALRHHRAEYVDRLFQLVDRHGGGGIDEIFERGIIVFAHIRVGQHHVDGGRRQEQVGHAVFFDVLHELGQLHPVHDDVRGAIGHERQPDHTRRVSHRRGTQMHRQLLRRHMGHHRGDHGLEQLVGPHDALGPAGRAAGREDSADIIGLVREVRRGPLMASDKAREGRRIDTFTVEADVVFDPRALFPNDLNIFLELTVIK